MLREAGIIVIDHLDDISNVDDDGIRRNVGLNTTIDIRTVELSKTHTTMEMPITAEVAQIEGFLHGGATLSLLESAASMGSWMCTNPDTELCFGTRIDVRHLNAGIMGGIARGEALLETEENLGERGRKQVWHVAATNEAGVLLSTGTMECRIVSKAYYANRQAASKKARIATHH